ncbi:MAG TPA: MYXO-CTERM sorting domain-containing protein [Anaerolineales bacterium]|nr:MYXO-CTERM sorting domain-containing protein [Anaerolineales bacterium]
MSNNINRVRPGLMAIAAISLLLPLAGAAFAADGVITSLSASDAPAFDQTITINASFQADSRINNSNVYYEILAPDGVTVVASHATNMPSMESGDTFSDSWTTTNSSFPASGTYTLRACWNNGGSTNCQIASASTSFFSVPTLGWWLTLAAVILLAVFLWRRRADFHKFPTKMLKANASQPSETSK